MDVNSPFSYIYIVLASDSSGDVLSDICGLTYLDPVNRISPEIRVNIGENGMISRLVMRHAKITMPVMACLGIDDLEQTILDGWECLDVELAKKKGYLKPFSAWNRPDFDEIRNLQDEFASSVMPYFKAVKNAK